MKIGFCTNGDHLALAKAAGADYVEFGFAATTQLTDSDFDALEAKVKASGLTAEAMNGFLPGDFKLCNEIPWQPVLDFVEKGMSRAKRLGVQVVVFGSSGARNIPEGVTYERAMERLTEFCRLAGDVASRYGITIAIEPLCHAETNVIFTFLDGYDLARRADHPSVRCLADLYHMGQNGEDVATLAQGGAWLRHCHIAWPDKRTYPLPSDGYDYAPFFRQLKALNYAGRVSIEASPVHSTEEDLAPSIAYLKSFA